jgi:formate dehydrogenase iron-sulfur subunit
MLAATDPPERTLIDELLAEQRDLSAVGRFSLWQDGQGRNGAAARESHYRGLLPATPPGPGEQYAFEVDLDKCSGCKACVTACHSLNGLDEDETWRSVGLLISPPASGTVSRITDHTSRVQHVTTACHHCVDPGCLNGCPVLAYEKDVLTGIVRHLDDQCIGCSYCVMKCPYEVPKYSARLGIVRKCDLCHQRLAVGEAPACAQACPDEAIRITVVRPDKVRGKYRGLPAQNGFGIRRQTNGETAEASGMNLFLAATPNPAITLPTTRYLTRRPQTALVAADHEALRRDHAHWPLVVMLVLTQAAAGMFVAASIMLWSGLEAAVQPVNVTGFAALVAGLVAVVFHLGQPLKAWRAFLGWRRSWLSREIIALNAFAGAVLLAMVYRPAVFGAALLGLVAVFTSAMVYVDTQRPLWSARFTQPSFFGTTLLLGAALAAMVCSFRGGSSVAAQSATVATLVMNTGLLVWRRQFWLAALRNPASPVHLNARFVRNLLPWSGPAHNRLFMLSTTFGLLATVNVANASWLWVSLMALAVVSSEFLTRYVFFVASAGRRMPGGVAA